MARVADSGREDCRDCVETERKDEAALAAKGIGQGPLDSGEFHRRIEHVGGGAEKGNEETAAQCTDVNGWAVSADAVDPFAGDDDLPLYTVALVGDGPDAVAPLLCFPAASSASRLCGMATSYAGAGVAVFGRATSID